MAEVLDGHLNRVQAQFFGQLVHGQHETEIELIVADTPHTTAGQPVGVDRLAFDTDVLQRGQHALRDLEPGHELEGGHGVLHIAARVGQADEVGRGDGAVFFCAQPGPPLDGRAGVVEILPPGVLEPDRAPGPPGKQGREQEKQLVAHVPAAHGGPQVGDHHPDLVHGQVQHGG